MRLLTYSLTYCSTRAKYLLPCAILVALLPACGEVSYKRGGSQQDIDRAHQACRGSGDQLAACLAEHGWQKPKVDAMDPLFATIDVNDNRQEAISKPSPFIEIAPAEKAPAADTAVAKTPQEVHEAKAEMPAAAATGAAVGNEEVEGPQSRSTVNDGPEVEYVINSWWKMGAFPQQLKQDQLSCEKKLGADYLPEYKTQTFKRAFVVCMHDLGWKAIRNVK